MKIRSIKAENFKRFSDVELNLDGKSTVIFGVNGTGKSTLLSVINYIMRTVIDRLNKSQSRAFGSMTSELVRIGSSKMTLCSCITYKENDYELTRMYKKAPRGIGNSFSSYSKNSYSDLVNEINDNLQTEKSIPIFVSYGTNRSVLDVPLRIRKKHDFSQLTAIEHAIDNSVDFRTFFEWFRNQEDIENEHIRETGDGEYEDKFLKCVRRAVEAMLGNVSDLRVRRNPLRMTVKKGNTEIAVDQLSDGEKCTLALFGDLARRIALANPNNSNPLEGEGIVLIDEIELHMHPSWQRRVLSVIKEVFPNIQFIITTHSPQILGEVDDSYNIFYLDNDSDNVSVIKRMDGFDTNYILEEFMGTSSVNPEFKKLLDMAYDEISENDFEKAQKLIKRVIDMTSLNNVKVIELEGALKRGKLLYEKNRKG